LKEIVKLSIVIVGTGYFGLTTGLALGNLGHRVTCVDKNQTIIDKLQSGTATIFEPGLDQLLKDGGSSVTFSTNFTDHLPGADLVIIAVGTPSKNNGDTDLCYVETVAHEIGKAKDSDNPPVIVNKSTAPIGAPPAG